MLKHDASQSRTYGKEGTAALRRISQDTFDDAVRENMHELDMSPEEALTEAIEQFRLEGVDLGNIDKRLPAEEGDAPAPKHPVLRLLDEVATAVDTERRVSALSELVSVLAGDADARTLAGHNEGVALLVRQLREHAALPPVLSAALRAVRCICTKNGEVSPKRPRRTACLHTRIAHTLRDSWVARRRES